jgi:hypothetical protein
MQILNKQNSLTKPDSEPLIHYNAVSISGLTTVTNATS